MLVPQSTAELERARRHGVGELLHRSAVRHPGKLAVVDGEHSFTYAEFDTVVDRIANALADRGLTKGDRLALLSRNCWEFGALAFATARLGVVLVPLNFGLTAPEVAFILDDAGVSGVVVQAALHPVAVAALAEAGIEQRVGAVIGGSAQGWEDFADWVATGSADPVTVAVSDDDPIRLMYTSGTESNPKGVINTGRALIAQYVSCVIDGGMTADDIEIHSLPMYHCAQLDGMFGVDIYLGATSIILPAPTPADVLAAIEKYGATKYFAPPTVWISLLAAPEFAETDLSTLAKGYYGASPMPVEVLRDIQRELPRVRLWNFYGQTELSPVATVLQPEDQVSRAGSAGRAAINVETAVIDEDGNPMPPGEIGEIVHRSPHICLGYYNQPGKTAEAFQHGWFHSGDLGFMDADGYLTVVDRKKDMIKTGGENVASREVEEAVYEVPGVAEVAVFAVPHPKWIEAVTAAVVAQPDSGLTGTAVEEYLAARLAPYKRPKYVLLVDELPKNPSGKIVKRALRERFADIASGDPVR